MTAAWGLTNRTSANVCRCPPVHKPRNTINMQMCCKGENRERAHYYQKE